MTPNPSQNTALFHLGLAVWSYPQWVGNFYPVKSQPQDFLSLYCDRFSTVEGNTTFYAVPRPETITQWTEKMLPSFQFCPKFPKTITHQAQLYPKISEAKAFLDRLEPLKQKIGAFFIQLPPSYPPQALPDLEQFLQQLPRNQFSFVVEVRHPDWFQPHPTEALNQILQHLNIGRVILDTRPVYQPKNDPNNDPQKQSRNRKPNLPVQKDLTANFTLIRFISHPQRRQNKAFLLDWMPTIKSWLSQEKKIYFFVHCPQEEHSPFIAKYFQQLLQKNGVNVPPLPWDNVPPPPQQLSLF